MKTQVIQSRTEPATKKKAEKIFLELGLNFSEAVNLFLKQVILHRGIPFEIKIPNATTRKAIKEGRRGKNLRSFDTVSDLMNHLHDEKN